MSVFSPPFRSSGAAGPQSCSRNRMLGCRRSICASPQAAPGNGSWTFPHRSSPSTADLLQKVCPDWTMSVFSPPFRSPGAAGSQSCSRNRMLGCRRSICASPQAAPGNGSWTFPHRSSPSTADLLQKVCPDWTMSVFSPPFRSPARRALSPAPETACWDTAAPSARLRRRHPETAPPGSRPGPPPQPGPATAAEPRRTGADPPPETR